MTTEMEWKDEPGGRGRRAWLVLVRGDEIKMFTGESIPGWVRVVGKEYRQNGKWSHHRFRLRFAEGVRAIPGRNGFECGTFRGGLAAAAGLPYCDTWGEFSAALGVSGAAAEQWGRLLWPKAAAAFDAAEQPV